MKHNKKDELFFQKLASLHAEKEGQLLKQELQDLAHLDYPVHLDQTVKRRIKSMKFKTLGRKFLPVAASLVVLTIFFASPRTTNPGTATQSPSQADESIQLLSAKLPAGYNLTRVDYDQAKTIYYIVNAAHNEIIVTTEAALGDIEKGRFQEFDINYTKVYGLVKNDYCLLQYEKDNTLYTLTSRYNYKDLIELSESLL